MPAAWLDMNEHLKFIELCKTDPRYVADANYIFESTVIPGDILHNWHG